MASQNNLNARPSAVAGTWYPGSSDTLRRMLDQFLAQVQPVSLPGRLVGVVSPHAGYAFSGPVAAYAYAQLRDTAFSRVILMGPLHRPIWGSLFGHFMVPAEDAYSTPLGLVSIDRSFIGVLGGRVKLTPVREQSEHSLEIQLPFLQSVLSDFTIVPILFGEHVAEPGALQRVDELAAALAALVDEQTLLVVSTDLSHLHNYADVVRTDHKLAEQLKAFDINRLVHDIQDDEVLACGATGLVTALKVAQQIGATTIRVLHYATSGDVTGNKRPGEFTVGYLAAAMYAQKRS